MDPIDVNAGGIETYATADGSLNREYQLYQDGWVDSGTFGKANGIGDVELVCAVAAPATYSLGNRVWVEADNDGVFEFANGELPLDGVTVNLYSDDGDGVLTAADGAPIASQVTYSGGFYRFGGLAAGDYIVEVDPANFSSGMLKDFATVTGNDVGGEAPDPDDDVDSDDNGYAVAGFGVASKAVTLGGSEPVSPADEDGADGNTTVDFGFYCPAGVGYEALVSNFGDSTVSSYDTAGNSTGPKVSGGAGSLTGAYGMVFAPGRELLVVSSTNHKVLRFNADTGAFLGELISGPPAGASVADPRGITFGPDGKIYVTWQGGNKITRHEPDGTFLNIFVDNGAAGLEGGISGIAFGPDGNLYASNYFASQVRRYDGQTGALIDSVAVPSSPRDIYWGPDGALYVTSETDKITRVTAGTPMVAAQYADGNDFTYYTSIALGPDGNYYAVNVSLGVQQVNTGGAFANWSAPGTYNSPKYILWLPVCATVPPPCPNPALWAVNEDNGHLFSVTDWSSTAQVNATVHDWGRIEWTDDGGATSTPIPNGGGSEVESAAIDFSTNEYYFSVNRDLGPYDAPILLKIDLDLISGGGPPVAEIIGQISAGEDIESLAMNPMTGELFGGSKSSGRLYKLNPSDASIQPGYPVQMSAPGGGALDDAESLTFDFSGNLYVSETDAKAVYRINAVTGAGISTYDDNTAPLGLDGLTWDFSTNRLIGFEDDSIANSESFLYEITEGSGGNVFIANTFDAGLVDIEGLELGCPPSAAPACEITAVTVSPGPCNDNGTPANGADDFYVASVTVTFSSAPAAGNLTLTGDASASVAVGSLDSATSHTFSGIVLPADGLAKSITATFSADAACTFANPAIAPVNSCASCAAQAPLLAKP
ncbi:MAG: SdrD B-like domain-containing protein [Verrucomicrobiales bacterium]